MRSHRKKHLLTYLLTGVKAKTKTTITKAKAKATATCCAAALPVPDNARRMNQHYLTKLTSTGNLFNTSEQ